METNKAVCRSAVARALEDAGYFNHRGEWRTLSG